MRTREFIAAALLMSFHAAAQSGPSVCGTILMGDERTRCLQAIAGHAIEPGAGGVCNSILMGNEKTACLRGAIDKHYQPDELAACRGILMGTDKANCIAAAGTLPRKQVEEERPVRRSRHDDDDDRPARRSRRSDDDDDRPSRRRMRTLRLTNYYEGSVTRIFWRLPDDRRFHEADLSADVATNQYLDVSVPDEAIEACIQTRDGFRLYWQRVRRSEDLTIAADEPNWAQARCRDLR